MVALTLVATSCSKDAPIASFTPNIPKVYSSRAVSAQEQAEQAQLNLELQTLARFISVQVNDNEFKQFLKNEAMKKQDGDYTVLFAKTLLPFLRSNGYNTKDIENLSITKMKNLQVSVPILCEKWECSNYSPLTAYIPFGLEEKEILEVNSFDSKQNQVKLSALKDPKVTTLVVGVSERVGYNGELFQEYETSSNLSTSQPVAGRVDNRYEVVTSVRCPNLNQIESWIFGAPELRFIMVTTNKTTKLAMTMKDATILPPDRNSVTRNNPFIVARLAGEGFLWNRATEHGTYYTIQWIETDNSGVSITGTIGANFVNTATVPGGSSGTTLTSSVSFTYKAQDRLIGSQSIIETEVTPRLYGIGDLLEFTVNDLQ